ncbi:sugar lactone lactonase YvrE [Biostraticola tofi]|uniref:Sugar lactone lactonase YvrE n=1 Tax=Biostraticola tofi TaxID=466109 RepID=A0A4R3Z267_9GAMM|nr:sugar lactone lactonase YvrE [Biostraticola tofi]
MSHFLNTPLEALGDYRAELGETPVWCSRSQSLLWVDILQRRLLRYWPETQKFEQRQLDCLFSAVLLTEEEEQFLVVSQQGIMLYHYGVEHPSLDLMCEYPEDPDATRPNEAGIAPDGSLWFSTMDLNEKLPIGGWYRYTSGASEPEKMLDNVTIPNTLAWFEDIVWFADSAEQRFYCSTGDRIDPERMRSHSADDKTPDGSALTMRGELITARFGHGCLSRYQIAAGELKLQEDIALPVLQPSCCAFGGPQLNELFITSARKQLDEPGELDGAVLHAKTTATGVPERRFRL